MTQLITEKQFKKAKKRLEFQALLPVVPLLLFIVVLFVVPISMILFNSVHNDTISQYMPNTVKALENWQDQSKTPDEAAYKSLVKDLIAAKQTYSDGKVATRLNYELSGFRSLVKKTARKADKINSSFKQALLEIDERWGDPKIWSIIKREGSVYTASFYIAAVDMKYDSDGNIIKAEAQQQIYLNLFLRTFLISFAVTVFCILLGFPVAYLLSTLPDRTSNLLMILVLLPFWTSLLVRTTSWIVLLQTQGPLNDLLVFFGIVGDSERVRMIYNMAGTLVAMTHILLPFMILPVYSIMKNIPPSYMRAAVSLGSSWLYAFRRVYFPLTIPGIGAGGLLVFILAIGYYITPALVGGSSGQLISNLIAFHLQSSLNWGLAAALSGLLLAVVLILYWLYNKWFGVDKISF